MHVERTVDLGSLVDLTDLVLARDEVGDDLLAVAAAQAARDDISSEDLAASGLAVLAGDIAVTHEGIDGSPTVSIGRLGQDPRTTAPCPADADTWDVAAAPDGGFYVSGTCGEATQLWLVR